MVVREREMLQRLATIDGANAGHLATAAAGIAIVIRPGVPDLDAYDEGRLSGRAPAADAKSARAEAARTVSALGSLLMMNPRADNDAIWPALPYADWHDTLDTLHMWTQIVGKVKLELTPFLNDWWNVTFELTARGLTTSTIPFGQRMFQVDFDFIHHRLAIHASDGRSTSMHLVARSVADFYLEFMQSLESLDIHVKVNRHPVEVDDGIPFEDDHVHSSYDPEYVSRWWRILLAISRLLERYRTPFVGKSSPVQFFWGSFDLVTTRYSGRPAPPREWPARWMALAAQQEQALAGFWPGNERLPEPALVAYTFPEPPGCRTAAIQPDVAYFHPELAEFILPYENVRLAADPDQLILKFYSSTYEIGATLAGWNRQALERPDPTRSDAVASRLRIG